MRCWVIEEEKKKVERIKSLSFVMQTRMLPLLSRIMPLLVKDLNVVARYRRPHLSPQLVENFRSLVGCLLALVIPFWVQYKIKTPGRLFSVCQDCRDRTVR
jgi:hypothetical protein